MLNWSVENSNGTKHYITFEGTMVHVTRIQPNGGRPLNIAKEFSESITYKDAITNIENLCNLDNSIYSMIAEHQSSIKAEQS